ncbi:MAG: nitroreductase family protein [Chitinophagaceae bacterium]
MEKIFKEGYPYISYHKETYPEPVMEKRSSAFLKWMNERRTVREFSEKQIPQKVIDDILLTASSAPSGAHRQPWFFCAVKDPGIKKIIRTEAEKEEYESYHGRMPAEWLDALKPLGTDWEKPFLETAPWLIVVFKRSYEYGDNKKKLTNYYVSESVGIACGFLLTAIHHAGLAALTHTPSPMNFLAKILNRPENEKPYLLIPVGYAADDCYVPDLRRKSLEEVAKYY